MAASKKAAPKRIKTYSADYWADERAPELDDLLLPLQIEVAPFIQWLSVELGRYRGREQGRPALQVPPSEQQAVLRKLGAALHELAPLLRRDAMPPFTYAELIAEGLRSDVDLPTLCARLTEDALTLEILVAAVVKKLSAARGRAGRKPKSDRNALLNAIVERLRGGGCTAERARSAAEEILVRARVSVPAHDRSIEKAISKARPKSGRT